MERSVEVEFAEYMRMKYSEQTNSCNPFLRVEDLHTFANHYGLNNCLTFPAKYCVRLALSTSCEHGLASYRDGEKSGNGWHCQWSFKYIIYLKHSSRNAGWQTIFRTENPCISQSLIPEPNLIKRAIQNRRLMSNGYCVSLSALVKFVMSCSNEVPFGISTNCMVAKRRINMRFFRSAPFRKNHSSQLLPFDAKATDPRSWCDSFSDN